MLAEALRGAYASTVLVENKPGASARIAVEYVKNAEPDGSVMLFTPDFPMTLYPHSFKSLSYDPLTDFTPVGPATTSMLSYNVGPAVPASVKTLGDYVQWCKANPDKASYGTTSAGATPHFAGVMLSNEAKVPMNPVHYRGGAPALQDVVGGHIPASVNPISESMPLHQAGTHPDSGGDRGEALAVPAGCADHDGAGLQRRVESWLGVFLPAKVPDDVRARVEHGDARSLAIGGDEGQPREVRQPADVPDAGAVHRDDQGRPQALGPGGEGIRLRRGGLSFTA